MKLNLSNHTYSYNYYLIKNLILFCRNKQMFILHFINWIQQLYDILYFHLQWWKNQFKRIAFYYLYLWYYTKRSTSPIVSTCFWIKFFFSDLKAYLLFEINKTRRKKGAFFSTSLLGFIDDYQNGNIYEEISTWLKSEDKKLRTIIFKRLCVMIELNFGYQLAWSKQWN